ncbi:MAG: response regulator, partial [Acidobacteriota bacterium]
REVVRDLVASLLALRGFKVELAENGRAALDYLKAHPADVIITDYFMPGMDGLELYRELLRLEPGLATRLILMSGNLVDRRVSEFIRTTGAPAIQKPFKVADLDAAVSLVLSHCGSSGGNAQAG